MIGSVTAQTTLVTGGNSHRNMSSKVSDAGRIHISSSSELYLRIVCSNQTIEIEVSSQYTLNARSLKMNNMLKRIGKRCWIFKS